LRIEPITLAHVPQAIALVRETLAEFGLTFGQGSATDAQMHELPGSYRNHGGEFFVAFDDRGEVFGTVIGTAGVAPVSADTFELRKMYLKPSTRGKGVGKALLDACLGFCRSRGAKHVVLDTLNQMQGAIAFYERSGFVRDDAQIRGSRCSRGYRLDL
jgi:putative acetyltransferase